MKEFKSKLSTWSAGTTVERTIYLHLLASIANRLKPGCVATGEACTGRAIRMSNIAGCVIYISINIVPAKHSHR